MKSYKDQTLGSPGHGRKGEESPNTPNTETNERKSCSGTNKKGIWGSLGGSLASINYTAMVSVGLHFREWKILGEMFCFGVFPFQSLV